MLNKSKAYPTDNALFDYAKRLGMSKDDAHQVLRRVENAYYKIMVDFKNDIRFQRNDLLKKIQKAIER